MDATRISIARALDLDVPMNWREVTAVLCEAVSIVRRAGGSSNERPPLKSWVVTRGGAVVLEPDAAQSRPEVIITLARDLLRTCRAPDALGEAMQSGRVLAFVDEFSERVSPNQRRVEIASLAWRALAAEADVASTLSEFGPANANGRPPDGTAGRLWSRGPARDVPPSAVDDFVFRSPTPFATRAAVKPRRRGHLRAVAVVTLAIAAGIAGWQWWRTSAGASPALASPTTARPASPPPTASTPPVPDDVDVTSVPESEAPAMPAEPPVAATPAPVVAETPPAADPERVVPEAPPAAEPAPVPYVAVPPLARSPDGTIDDPILPWQSAGVEPPVLVSRLRPGSEVLPQNSRGNGITIEVLVDRAGRVEDARILLAAGGMSRDRQRAVLAAARRWQFIPARLDGRPVRSTTRVTVPP